MYLEPLLAFISQLHTLERVFMSRSFPMLPYFYSLQFTLGINVASLFDLAKTCYGDYFRIRVLGTSVYCITNPSAISALEKYLSWNTSHKTPVTNGSAGPFLQEVNPGFLLFTDLSHHKSRKSTINHFFTSVDNDTYIERLTTEYRKILPSLRAKPFFDLSDPLFTPFMVNLVSYHFYGITFELDEISRLDKYLKRALWIFRLSLALPAPLIRSRFSPFLTGFREERAKVRYQLQSRLLENTSCPFQAKYINSFQEKYLNSDHSVKCAASVLTDDALGLFIAGIDTVMASLDLILKIISSYPSVCEQIRNEYHEVTGDFDHYDARLLKYARCVVLEVLRLYPVFPHLFKTVTEELVVDGFLLPSKSLLYIHLSAIHRDSRWFVDPLLFKPERWSGYVFSSDSTNTFLPFGLGAHHCPGAELAILELSALISLLLADFHVCDHQFLKEGGLPNIPLLFNGLSIRPRRRAFLVPL